MDYSECIEFVGKKMKEAQEKDDKEEWIRLAKVLIKATQDQIDKLSK